MAKIHNQEKFLTHVASKLGRKRRSQQVERPNWTYQPQWDVLADYSIEELVDVLEKQCAAIHTDFYRTNMKGLPNVVLDVIRQYDGHRVITWDDPRFLEYGLEEYWQLLKNEEEVVVHQWDPTDREESIRIAEQADVGITFSDITLAESGTVVLFSGRGQGRSVSLLPKTYIAIIPKSTIVPRMSQATREIHQRIQTGQIVPSCVNFISGPSNSADIEMNLVVGVHGPYKAAYIVVEDR